MKTTRRKALAMLGMLPATVSEVKANGYRKGGYGPGLLDPPKLGILSPFKLLANWETAILAGWLPNRDHLVSDQRGFDEASLKGAVNDLLAGRCTIIATLGGLRVYEILNQY